MNFDESIDGLKFVETKVRGFLYKRKSNDYDYREKLTAKLEGYADVYMVNKVYKIELSKNYKNHNTDDEDNIKCMADYISSTYFDGKAVILLSAYNPYRADAYSVDMVSMHYLKKYLGYSVVVVDDLSTNLPYTATQRRILQQRKEDEVKIETINTFIKPALEQILHKYKGTVTIDGESVKFFQAGIVNAFRKYLDSTLGKELLEIGLKVDFLSEGTFDSRNYIVYTLPLKDCELTCNEGE